MVNDLQANFDGYYARAAGFAFGPQGKAPELAKPERGSASGGRLGLLMNPRAITKGHI